MENRPPTASFTASPTSGKAPLSVDLDGSASSDPDGQVAAYAWAFGDGGTATGTSASHTYAAAGTYTAKLTVTDDGGATASTTRTITVSRRASPPPAPRPTLSASKPTIGKAAAGKAFTVSFAVRNAKTGKGVLGTLSCSAKLAGKPLATSHRSNTASRASCTWQLPRSTRGKQFTGTIAKTYQGAKVSRTFTVKIT